MSGNDIEFLESSNYLSFSTLKKSGDFVTTPVWFGPGDGSYYIFSAGEAGKVKRLRNFTDCKVAACTATGTLTGDWIEGDAYLLEDDDDIDAALAALHNKYGWQMKMTDFFSRLSGKIGKRTYIRVDLAD